MASEDREGSLRFLLLNALANGGGVIAFLPLLSLLLPLKIERIAGDARIDVLTATVIVGALVASGSNILFGWLSDRAVERGTGRRAGLMRGLALTILSYAGVAAAASPVEIVVAIAFFQFAVNALLAPLFAIMADEIPDSSKRTAGGLLALGHPLAAAVSAMLVAWPLPEGGRLAVVAGAVALSVVPMMATRVRPAVPAPANPAVRHELRRDLLVMWASRLLVQVAGTALSLYLLYYFETIVPGLPQEAVAGQVGGVLALSYFLPLPIAVLIGRWSDSSGRGKPFLFAAAGIAALGLIGMALAQDWTAGAAAFAVYSIGWSVFLALHSGFAMQLLPNPRRRGRDLGLINLTNTLPQLLGPLLTWLLATPHDFDAALLTLAALSFQFIKDVPANWIDTRVLNGAIGDYVTFARRARGDSDWYLGAVGDEEARMLTVRLDFLAPGTAYEAQIYRDGDDADYRSDRRFSIVIEKRKVTAADTLTLKLAPGGGQAIRFKALKP